MSHEDISKTSQNDSLVLIPDYDFVRGCASNLLQILEGKVSVVLVPDDNISMMIATMAFEDRQDIKVSKSHAGHGSASVVCLSSYPRPSSFKQKVKDVAEDAVFVTLVNTCESQYADHLLSTFEDVNIKEIAEVSRPSLAFIVLNVTDVPLSQYVCSKHYTADGGIKFVHNSEVGKLNYRLQKICRSLLQYAGPKIFESTHNREVKVSVLETQKNRVISPDQEGFSVVTDVAVCYNTMHGVEFSIKVLPHAG